MNDVFDPQHPGLSTVASICRHGPGDRDCSKSGRGYYGEPYSSPEPKTPDASNYSIEEAVQVGHHMVLKVKYPNCSSCAYEGNKIMVFLDTKPIDVMKWKKIDPHFRSPSKYSASSREAPSPAARFPATAEGYTDAVAYAERRPGTIK